MPQLYLLTLYLTIFFCWMHEAFLAITWKWPFCVDASPIFTKIWFIQALVYIGTIEPISRKSIITYALKTSWSVYTGSMQIASSIVSGTFIDILILDSGTISVRKSLMSWHIRYKSKFTNIEYIIKLHVFSSHMTVKSISFKTLFTLTIVGSIRIFAFCMNRVTMMKIKSTFVVVSAAY